MDTGCDHWSQSLDGVDFIHLFLIPIQCELRLIFNII